EADRSRREEEVGDLLFVLVNLARFLGFDPEVALKHSNLKFKSRFQHMELDAARSGQRLAQLSKEELEVLWESAKKFEHDEASQELKSSDLVLERNPDRPQLPMDPPITEFW